MGWGRSEWRPYVPVGQKLAKAAKQAAQAAKKQGREPSPVKLEGKKIATTFWGKAWCDNLAAYSDYANRLPRGVTYVRNGSVVDLVIKPRSVEAIVAGSVTYKIKIEIDGLAKLAWKKIKQDCSASIDSLLDLLAGRFSDGVMQRLTQQKDGLFPSPREIKMKCSCPDSSYCCKHLAAVMYGIGARLDKQPELLFRLRDVDHQELVSQAVAEGNLDKELTGAADSALAGEDLGAMFGIELETTAVLPQQRVTATRQRQTGVARSQKAQTKTATKAKTKTALTRKKAITSKTKSATQVVVKKSTTTKKPGPTPKKSAVVLTAPSTVPKRATKKTA